MLKWNSKSFITAFLLFAILFTSANPCICKNRGSYVKVNIKEGIEKFIFKRGEYIKLYRGQWGKDILIDSTIVKSTIIFSGDSLFEAGEYTLKDKHNVNILEFMVSDNYSISEYFKIHYNSSVKHNAEPDCIEQIKGNTENRYFVQMQNIAATNINKENYNALKEQISALCDEVTANCKGTLLQYLCDYSFAPQKSARDIAEIFPLSDNRIINTRFGKLAIDNLLKRTEENLNEVIIYFANKIISRSSEELKPLLIANMFLYYQESHIMGQEAIAVYLAKEYFLNGKYKWPYDEDEFLPKSYVFMNEHSLIGEKAPELILKDTSNTNIYFPAPDDNPSILYFYAPDCTICKIEVPLLMNFLKFYSGKPLNVYAVNVSSNKEEWMSYIKTNFNIDNTLIHFVNAWDPAIESNFPMLYGVISTPKLFLINKTHNISGRRLSIENLGQLLNIENNTSK